MISFFKDGISAMAFVSPGITITLYLSQQKKNITIQTYLFLKEEILRSSICDELQSKAFI
jgi:hypothetical protein